MKFHSILLPLAALLMASCSRTDTYTRGIGVYPGSHDEYSGPEIVSGGTGYRNLALKKAAYHSSSYDYNLTAQLATDGIISESHPYYIEVSTSEGVVEKRDRERIFDDNTTNISVKQTEGAYFLLNMINAPITAAKTISFTGALNCNPSDNSTYDISIEACGNDGKWQAIGTIKGKGVPGPGSNGRRGFDYRAELPEGTICSAFRLNLNSPAVYNWDIQEVNFLDAEGSEISLLPSYYFNSCWMSESADNEWIYVDFGDKASFDKIKLNWIAGPESGLVEVSNDAINWKKIAAFNEENCSELQVKGKGRYVKLSDLKGRDGSRLILSEMEVWGKGGSIPRAKAQSEVDGNRLYLSGGNWKLERSSEVSDNPEQISLVGFDDSSWLTATVPATVAGSYFNAGAIPDIRYDDDQFQISESYFYSDFWYRDEFELRDNITSNDLVLNFDGINWKAEVWFNGNYLGRIDGAFTRAHFNVSGLAVEGTNAIAVKIIRNLHQGIVKEQTRDYTDVNGGVLGADNPTMHATIGWDWIPTVRGRSIGIWNDVFLASYDGGVSIDDVFVDTDLPLPDTDYANLSPIVTLSNHSATEKDVKISLKYGDIAISGNAKLQANSTTDVVLETARMENPRLWWPAGYGEPYLHDVCTTVWVDGLISDTKEQKSGVRKMSYTTDNGILDMYVNGRRLIGNGGNWGYPEIYNNYRGREYDIAVALHADMNFTMIRNWVGMTGDEEFYEACDRHGVMVWQDFWLANPVDGPNPYYDNMFLANADDYIRKIRNHPSIAVYIGRNEGNPPEYIDGNLKALVDRLHPGMFYYPNSASGLVSGGGPYRALPVEEYFATERGRDRFHSERGMPNVMTYESLLRTFRKENQWPQTSVWGVHDYTLSNAQSAATFNQMIEKAFGEPESLKQFAEYAQWINYNGYRAIFESRSPERKGIQLWMSHSCWPSMVWQTYDYYFEPTAAYFGSKKGSAPIRIQWNPVDRMVEVVNNNASQQNGLTATAMLVNFDGKIISEQSAQLDSEEDSTTQLFSLDTESKELTDVYYISLKLTRGNEVLADNFYWEGRESGNYKQLLSLKKAKLDFKYKLGEKDGEWSGTATVTNDGTVPALMIRLKLRTKDGDSILPVFYQDNYFSLLPGETKNVQIRFRDEDTQGKKPVLDIEGFNL